MAKVVKKFVGLGPKIIKGFFKTILFQNQRDSFVIEWFTILLIKL